jgi:transcriptional regulator with XRE-family HTH domain
MTFRIKEAREAAGLSQAQLAEYLGINATTLSGYETGRHDPKSDTLIMIAKVCCTTVDYLLDHEPAVNERLSTAALNIAHKYDSLDEWGKRAIDAIMDVESQRNSRRSIEDILDEAEQAAEEAIG